MLRGTKARRKLKRTVKLIISATYFVFQISSRLIARAGAFQVRPKLTILYYHGIPDRWRPHFVRQMEAINRGARVFPAFYGGTLRSDKPNVAITFDDAYMSVRENALPELAKRGFHSTIFVPFGWLGRPPAWSMEDDSPDSEEIVMSSSDLERLSSPLVTLGSHTFSHPRLSQIDSLAACREVEASLVALQNLTTPKIRMLAFPYGDHDSAVIEMCMKAGYDVVFSTTPHGTYPTSSEFVRGRIKADPFDSILEFYLKYHGAYEWVPIFSSINRKTKNLLKALGRSRSIDETGNQNKRGEHL